MIRLRRRRPDIRPLDVAAFADATSVTLTTSLNQILHSTDDGRTIEALLELIGRYPDGWSVPRNGVPIAELRLNFYGAVGQPLGNVGIGRTFLSAHQSGGFRSRTVDGSVREQTLSLLGVRDPDAS
ncbi:MAG: hypothetical protein JWO62_3558 [Acidimicrobiaceae bacterium]|nr:hypothetical protein [Acidimicrobiaceae bacterium]